MTPPPRRRNRPNDYTVIDRGMELLRSGTLAGELSDRLRDEFGLSPDRARELAGKAKEIYEKLNGTK